MMFASPIVLMALFAPPAQDAAALTRDAMRADLEQLARDVRANWSYFDDHTRHFGVDLDAWVAREIEELPDTEHLDGFTLRLRRIVADLSDGHARLEVPGSAAEPIRRWPFVLRAVDEGAAVSRLAEGLTAPPEGAGIPRVGDLLRKADGRAIDELWDAALRLTMSSTPGMRRARALKRLCATDAPAVAFEFERPDGTRFVVDLPTVDAGAAGIAPRPEPSWSTRAAGEGIALLRIASFAMPDWEAWLAADQGARDAMQTAIKLDIDELLEGLVAEPPRALVIDLRGNGGGTDSLGIHFAERLLPEEFVYFRLSAQTNGGWTEPHGFTYGTRADLPRLICPTVALIDEGCFSTTDNFLRALDVLHPDFTSVGRATGAGTGAPRVVAELAKSGARITLCTQRVYAPDGSLTEGRGTQPDVPVTWSREDLTAARDSELAAAFAILRERGLLSK